MSVYGWLWRTLPGPAAAKAAQAAVLVLAVVAACFTWAFPTVAPHLPLNHGTIQH